jgi:hypothetical protein
LPILTTLQRLVQAVRFARILRSRGGLFDADYYRAAHPDIAAAGVIPFLHFMVAGAFEGRRPHPLFDAAFYLRKYPDVAAARKSSGGPGGVASEERQNVNILSTSP